MDVVSTQGFRFECRKNAITLFYCVRITMNDNVWSEHMNYYLRGRRYRMFVNFRYVQHIPELFKDILYEYFFRKRRFQLPPGLRRRAAAARLLGLWVRIPPKAWIFVCCECYVLSGRGLWDELITRSEESYRLW